MRNIIYVDGAVGVGKSTFIKILAETFNSVLSIKNEQKTKTSHNFNVEVLPEPLHRDWTKGIIDKIEYGSLLAFLLIRKIVAISDWSKKIASDGLQELENNVLIVERSLYGDRRVNDGYKSALESFKLENTGENIYYVFVTRNGSCAEEQERLNALYNGFEMNKYKEVNKNNVFRITRPNNISSYHIEAAIIVNKVLGI